MLTKKKVCFFVRIKNLDLLKCRQWYGNDIKILEEMGFQVIVATKFKDIPFNCDLYFSWFTTGSILPLIKAKICRKPIIVIAGGSEVVAASFGYFSKPWYVKLCVRMCLRYADAVLAVSKNIFDEIKLLGVRNPFIVYNGVDTKKFEPSVLKKDIIFFCSRQDRHTYKGKKIELVLESFPFVLKKFPEQKLVIAGRKSDAYIKTKNLIEKLGIADNVELTDIIHNDKIAEYFKRALICVQPTRYESFGFATAEAMSCGVPVITNRVGAVPEVVGDCGVYLDSDNPIELANKIIYLLENKKNREELGLRARKRIEEHFSLEARKEKLKNIINLILTKNTEEREGKLTVCLVGNINSIHFRKRIDAARGNRNFIFHIIDLLPRGNFDKRFLCVDDRNVFYHLIPTPIKSKVRYFLYFWKIGHIVKKIKPDILHCYGAGIYGFVGLLLNISPLIISIYGSEVLHFKSKNFFYRKLIKIILKKADILTYASVGMKNFLTEQFNISPKNLEKLYWGFDEKIFYKYDAIFINELRKRMGISENDTVFFSNRRIAPLYNIKYILSAFYKVNEIFKNTKLILISGGVENSDPYFSDIENQAEKGIEENKIILIKELVSLRTMARLYNISDFFISLPDSDELSAAILEGMACGTIPVLSNLEAYAELEEKTNSFFVKNPKNIDEVSRFMMALIKNHQDIKEKISQRNQQYVRDNMAYSQVENQLLGVYNNLLEKIKI